MSTLLALVDLLEKVIDMVDLIKGPAPGEGQLDAELAARLVRLAKRLEAVPARWQQYDAALARRVPPR